MPRTDLSRSTQLLAHDTAFTLDPAIMVPQYITNVVGPTIVAQTFLPLVEKSRRKIIVNVSSALGSIAIGFGERTTSYALTKAALNMLVSTASWWAVLPAVQEK